MSTATCDFRFSLQNRYAGVSLVNGLAELGIPNQAVTISGHATMSEREISKEDFIAASVEEIRTRLKRHLEKHEPRAGDLMILDMEPKGIAPVRLGEFVRLHPLRSLRSRWRGLRTHATWRRHAGGRSVSTRTRARPTTNR